MNYQRIKCLHICNDLLGSKVHHNLYEHLGKNKNLSQSVFYPTRQHTQEYAQKFAANASYPIIVSHVLKKYHRFLFRRKITYLYNDLKSRTELSRYDIIHATTLFSDGAVALKIFKEFGTPYIIAVRGTDINLFIKYRKDLSFLLLDILRNSSRIIFISESLRTGFINSNLSKKLIEEIKWKCDVIPNGLDDFWLRNITAKKNIRPNRILYIGKFNKNKNVLKLIESLVVLREKYPDIKLDLVGAGGIQEKQIRYIAQDKYWINFLGAVYDKHELRKIYQSNHIFAMISRGETFGLVYVEALTQGLPILFTENQGIDGTFENYVGTSVNPKSVSSIADGLEKIIENYNNLTISDIDFSKFSWDVISANYFDIYCNINSANMVESTNS